MKKHFLSMLVVVMVVVISGASIFAAPKSVTIRYWYQSQNKILDEYFVDAVKAFEKNYPNIKVEVTTLPQAQADQDLKLNAAVLSGTYPDVISAMLSQIGTRGSQGEFYPLDRYINSWKDKTDIYESVYELGKLKGKTLGLGYSPNPDVLVYRKDYFKEAGLDPEKPPTNWDELASYAKKLTIKDGNNNITRAGLDIPALNSSAVIKMFGRQNNAIVINERKEKPMLDDPALIQAVEFMLSLKDSSIPFNYVKKDTTPFIYGRSAMSFMQPSQAMTMIANDPSMKNKIGFAPVINGKKKVAWCGFRLFAIGSGSKYKKEAWEFIKFMMSQEQMTTRFKDLKIPVVRKSLENDYIKDDPSLNKAILEYVKYGQGDNLVEWNTIATKYIHLAYEEAYSGKKTVAQAFKDGQNALLNDLKNMKK